jgi:hypothetical protein
MRRRLATTRIVIQAEALPPSAENTQLNYRTRVTTKGQDAARTIRLVSVVTLNFIVIAFGLRILTLVPYFVSVPFFVCLIVLSLTAAYSKFLKGRPSAGNLIAVPLLILICLLFALVDYAPTTRSAYVLIFGAAVIGAATLSHFITLQSCYFMAVNERLRLRTMRRYQRYWWFVPTLKTPRHCPEVATYRESLAAVAAAFAVGYGVLLMTERTHLSSFAAMFGVIGFVAALPAFWMLSNDLGWLSGSNAPQASLALTVRATWRALTTFVCYNRHNVQAAGLFRFPTKALRPPWSRDAALGATLALLTTALVGVSVSSPQYLIEQYWKPSKAAAPVARDATATAPQTGVRPAPFVPSEEDILTPAQRQFASQLSPEQRARYLAEKKRDREAKDSASWWTATKWSIEKVLIGIAAVLLLCWLGPFAVLFAVLWFTGGRLLARYYQALEAHDAYELPPEPTKKELESGKRGITPWDNRIERIIWSPDELEAEHFYLGSGIEGDYPVLLHRDLLNAHAHILGDTGSRKTSIGIAPLLTQIIARQDSSILIIDLKGDKSLFEAAREEADTAGIPFKWFTNVTGRSSYVFNPFAQSHVHRLTTNQLTQGILQALALEYGEDYGRGYYSAMNELVLTGYLRNHRKHIRSFRELHRFLCDKAAYPGSGEDWEKTRHVTGVVDKLAQVGPMNVTGSAGGGSAGGVGSAGAVEAQIDIPSMLREKQVIYFYLSSAQEQASVPKIAKLAMFSLLTAASRREKGEDKRVYVFVDEFQRVISENISIFLEQARSFKLHFILANQTIGQLEKDGVNLTDVVESCTAYKQSFRATDEKSIKRIMESSGEAIYHSMQWTQFLNDAFVDTDDEALSFSQALAQGLDPQAHEQGLDGVAAARVSESEGPRLERNTVIEVSAMPLASFVRFSESSGYTQFSGYRTTVLSEYHITKALFGHREETGWPEVDERTVLVTPDEDPIVQSRFIEKNVPIAKPTDVPKDFDADLEQRLDAAGRPGATAGRADAAGRADTAAKKKSKRKKGKRAQGEA